MSILGIHVRFHGVYPKFQVSPQWSVLPSCIVEDIIEVWMPRVIVRG